jgi:hypothetical protein
MVALSIHTYANVGPNIWLRSAYICRTSIVTSDTRHQTPDTRHQTLDTDSSFFYNIQADRDFTSLYSHRQVGVVDRDCT